MKKQKMRLPDSLAILKNIKLIGLAIKIKEIIVIGDIHIGYEEALAKQGILMPRFHFKDIMGSAERILKKTKPKTIILIGDLKHEFGRISDQEWRDTLRFLALLQKYAKKIILIKGNHDNILAPIARKKGLEIVDKYILKDNADNKAGDILFIHGNALPKLSKTQNKKIKTIIIGHEHAAVSIGTCIRREKYKCFLLGKYEDKDLIVMPSFNPIVEGTDMIKECPLGPFLTKYNLFKFTAFAVDENGKAYKFGTLKDIYQRQWH